MLILASQSASRRAMLAAAGIPFAAEAAGVDEDAAKASLAGLSPRDLADALAELKALKVSVRRPEALVLGSDSVVTLADGTLLDKPTSREEAAEHLARMSGGVHRLWSAAVMAESGVAVWRHVEAATLHVRPLSYSFIQRYLDAEWPARECVRRRVQDRGARRAAVRPDRGQPLYGARSAVAAGAGFSAQPGRAAGVRRFGVTHV